MVRRRTMFTSNLEIVNNMQFAFDNGQSSYDLRVNCFADLSFEEFGAGKLSQLSYKLSLSCHYWCRVDWAGSAGWRQR